MSSPTLAGSPHELTYKGRRRTGICRGRTAAFRVRRLRGDHAVRVDHVLLGRSSVELRVRLRSLIEGDRGGVHRLGDLRLAAEDQFHQAPVVSLHRALTRGETV